MIFIVVKFTVTDDYVDDWLTRTAPFTEATRAEPGTCGSNGTAAWTIPPNSSSSKRSRDEKAGADHVGSDHFHGDWRRCARRCGKHHGFCTPHCPRRIGRGWVNSTSSLSVRRGR